MLDHVWSAMRRRKTIENVLAETGIDEHETKEQAGGLKRCLTRWDVVAYGVSSTVGAGIFVITGPGAKAAGPAVVLSFIIASFCCLCSAFCYAEFAARVPVSGSAYTFTYVCMGEFAAWFVGWNLTLEYAISAAAVARGWSQNFVLFWRQIGVTCPDWLNSIDINITSVSPLSLVICLACTAALLVGAKESAFLNKCITALNIVCISFIIILGSTYVHTDYWTDSTVVSFTNTTTNVTTSTDLAPSECSGDHKGFVPCGFNGILLGAVKIFFSYIGFDSVTTLSEEVRNPRKDIPFGVIVTLTIAAVLYIATALVITGMRPWVLLDQDTPLATAFNDVGVSWAGSVIAACTVTALSVTTLCSLFGQPRIFYRMAKDGLLFAPFGRLTQRSQVPMWGTLFSGVCAGLIAFFLDINILADMISMGTLLAFSTVCAGIVLLRVEHPTHPSRVPTALIAFVVLVAALSFALRFVDTTPLAVIIILAVLTVAPVFYLWRLPGRLPDAAVYSAPMVPFLPLLGIFFNVYLICSNTALSFYRLIVWTVIGCSLYFFYGMRHSRLASYSINAAMYTPLRSSPD